MKKRNLGKSGLQVSEIGLGCNAFGGRIDLEAARGCSLLELAFGWLLARPAVASVIAGATKPGQLTLNVESSAWMSTAEDMAEIEPC